jgi:putative ABC transport system permease protein
VTSSRRFFLTLLNRCRPAKAEPDLERELQSHLELLENDYRRRGLSADEARLAATRTFGRVAQTIDTHRDARSFLWLDDARRDLQYAARNFRRTPTFSAIAIVTIALGIGANVAIFSVVRAVMLEPLPYVHPERLVRPYENIPASESSNHRAVRISGMSALEVAEVRERTKTLSQVVTVGGSLVTMLGRDSAFVNGASLSPGTAAMLGVRPALGRWFTPDEERSGSRALVLSDVMWRRYFSGRPDVLSATVTFTGNSAFVGDIALGTAYSIVGVMPRGFHFPNDRIDFWTPAPLTPPRDSRRRTSMFAQLGEGITIQAATADLAAIVAGARGRTTSDARFHPTRFELVRLDDAVSQPVRAALLILMGSVGFVLMIACANVANLLLARTAARERELAVRVSLGAGRGRLARQLLTESLLLAVIGGIAGTALAHEGIAVFRSLGTTLARFDLGDSVTFPRLGDIVIDPLVLIFAVAVTIVTALLFGVAPALRAARAVQTTSYRRSRVHHALVVAEIALAVPLVVGGGLLVRSFVKLVSVDPGYDASHALTFQVGARGDRHTPAQFKFFSDDLIARLGDIPDVVAAGYSRQLPMVDLQDTHSFRTKPDIPAPGPPPDGADGRYVSPGYLQAIGARLMTGHWIDEPRQVLINRTLARREFGDQNPVGATVYIGRSAVPREVAGVVDDERLFGLDREPPPQFFADLSLWDGPPPTLFPVGPYFVVRTRGNPATVVRDVTTIVRQLDPEAPLYNVATLETILSNSVTLSRMYAVLLGVFSALGVLLAAVGIYGVMAYAVAQRTREIGIRLALGARRTAVLGMVVRQGATMTGIGIGIGLIAAAGTSQWLRALLFGVTTTDRSTFIVASTIFAAVGVAASYIPARRAARVDPSVALRCE